MKSSKKIIYGTFLAVPFIALLFYLLNPLMNPPQCPLEYTQQQVDASGCIIGANIGGFPIFIVLAVGTWFFALWLVNRLVRKHN